MIRILFVLALAGVSLGRQTDYTAGQQGPFCGVIESYRTIGRGSCELHLTLKAAGASTPLDIVIPDAIRKQMSARAADYFQEDLCVSGTIGGDRPAPYVLVTAPSQIERKSHRNTVPFGGNAVDTCAAGVRPPRLLKETKPSYTESAMRQKIEGIVVMDVVVGPDGRVADARVMRSLEPSLDEQALGALRQWEFQPGTRDDKPVSVIVTIEMTFALRHPLD